MKFVDGDWYKFTKKTATKEQAILKLCEVCNISVENIIAFGDDLVDIGMLQLCGKGVAMGNALQEVKNIADIIIGTNDEDGIADSELMMSEFKEIILLMGEETKKSQASQA